MTDCTRARDLIEDAVHGHLGPDAAGFVARHVAVCSACALAHERVDRQRALVASFAPRLRAPDELRAAVGAAFRRTRRARWRPLLVGALAAGLVLGVAWASGLVAWRPGMWEVVVREAVDDHIRVVLRQQTGATGPSDATTLQRLSAAVLDYPVPRPGAGDTRFRLAGGRPSYIVGQRVACFYYRSDLGYASLFVLPLDRLTASARRLGPTPSMSERNGYRLAHWRREGYAYVLVSDAPPADVLALASALRAS